MDSTLKSRQKGTHINSPNCFTKQNKFFTTFGRWVVCSESYTRSLVQLPIYFCLFVCLLGDRKGILSLLTFKVFDSVFHGTFKSFSRRVESSPLYTSLFVCLFVCKFLWFRYIIFNFCWNCRTNILKRIK